MSKTYFGKVRLDDEIEKHRCAIPCNYSRETITEAAAQGKLLEAHENYHAKLSPYMLMGAGSFVGSLELLVPQKRTACLRAETDCVVLLLSNAGRTCTIVLPKS